MRQQANDEKKGKCYYQNSLDPKDTRKHYEDEYKTDDEIKKEQDEIKKEQAASEGDKIILLTALEENTQWGTALNWSECSSEPLSEWNTEQIKVSGDGSHVTELWLNCCGLEGELPAALSQLTCLKILYLPGNPGITGTIPETYNQLAPSLIQLNLENTGISTNTGDIPEHLANNIDCQIKLPEKESVW